ncbi:MAG: nickel pincer cofactor biosynthesis protein LarC [Acidobacteria bacterium]|nr:MAG: nickel pincer cofactor biosynthesis protein LarC [Acidobacteriota bacterium]
MRIAYLDCFSGMSGDMFLGALVDAGIPSRVFEETVKALDIGARLEISRVNRSGISAIKVDVLVHGEKELPREVYWEQQAHQHEEHEHGHKHDHGSAHTHEDKHEHGHGRGLKEIKQIISTAAVSETAKQTAIAIFQALGEAESKIHNTDVDSIHFHEVGAVDAMVDILCAAVGAEVLGADDIVCSPLNVGGGTVKCAHGVFPVPAPATVELLKGAPVYSSGLNVELVTPTGAAIVKVLSKRFASFPQMKIEKTGYGAGTRDFQGHANVVRLTVGDSEDALNAGATHETVSVVEANLDDLNPQVFGYVMDRLLEEGALDVFGIPVQMKKNRPGTLLTVLCRPQDSAKLTKLIFQALQRKWVTVVTRWGEVRLKIASMNGTITNYAPEYEDCRRIAAEQHVPLKTVMQEALQNYLGTQPDQR